uniref:WAP domain-containing protein n=1 Tax=Periophthalmus magnuspinnatus TaxID=409849 RepID=A0A3B3ZGS0_9GOBI
PQLSCRCGLGLGFSNVTARVGLNKLTQLEHLTKTAKPGFCLKPRTDIVCTSCGNQCSRDSDCEGILKCCFNGCGRVCGPKTKQGLCPSPGAAGICACSDDSQCPKNLKCCYSGCGLQCVPPAHGNSQKG